MSFTDFKEITSPTTGTVAKYGSQDLLDVMQILNGKIVAGRRPKVANTWLWQGPQDIAEIIAPSTPEAGTQRFYIDAADHIPKMKDSSGAVIAFSAAGSNVNINQSNTYGDFDQIFRSTRLKVRNPANTQSYSLVGSAITSPLNITLPLLTSDDTIVTQDSNQTITNKTIDDELNTRLTAASTIDFTVYKSGTNYKARNHRLGTTFTSSDARTVFQFALDTAQTANGNTGNKVIKVAGTTNDTFPINSPGIKLDDGAGTYYNNVTIMGELYNTVSSGLGPDIRKGTGWTNDGNEALISHNNVGAASAAHVDFPTFYGLQFHPELDDTTIAVASRLNAIRINPTRLVVSNCAFTYARNGIWAQNSSPYTNDDTHIFFCRFRYCERGIFFNGVAASKVQLCNFGFMHKDSIECNGYSHMIVNNKFWQCSSDSAGFYQIWLNACNYGLVANNQIEPDNQNPNGIGLTNSSSFNLIIGNRMKTGVAAPGGRNGIVIDGASATGNIIIGNNIGYDTTGLTNIRAYKEQNSATGNIFYWNTTEGGTFPNGAWELSANSTRVDRYQQDFVTNATAPAAQSTATAMLRNYGIIRDSNNNGMSTLAKINGAVVEVKAF